MRYTLALRTADNRVYEIFVEADSYSISDDWGLYFYKHYTQVFKAWLDDPAREYTEEHVYRAYAPGQWVGIIDTNTPKDKRLTPQDAPLDES